MPAPRILVSGDVLGQFNQLFKRVQSVNASSGPFDALFCVGQFFPSLINGTDEISDYLEGRSVIPIPTYFIGDYGAGAAKYLLATSQLHKNLGFISDGLKVCDNLYWLRGSGVISFKDLRIAYLSGRSQYNDDDVGALRLLAEEQQIFDIFLTNEWPRGITNRADTSTAPAGVSDPGFGNSVVSELASEIKPRYHFAGTNSIFYAREPFLNDIARHVTRFVGLAAVGNKNKQKFLHAISPTPAKNMSPADLNARPAGTTISPYLTYEGNDHPNAAKRAADDELGQQSWRYDMPQKRQRQAGGDGERLCFKFTSTGSCPRDGKCNFRHDMEAREQYLRNVCFDFLNKGKCERGPDCKFIHRLAEESDPVRSNSQGQRSEKGCWFCLSSPNVESHLIICVGENYYCALAKGPLVEDHALLIPVEHCPNTLSLSSASDPELEGFKISLRKFFHKRRKAVIFFEFLFRRSPHANLQVVPVPLSKASNVERAFGFAAKNLGFEYTVTKPGHGRGAREKLREQFDGRSNFFYVELPDGTILSYAVEDEGKFPVQFGREVLAGLLNAADKADWRNCNMDKEEESRMAEGFRDGFEEFHSVR
ncbi:cwfJ-like family protein / zinc finger (CCCH-type) family protein [Wolffia australiana]